MKTCVSFIALFLCFIPFISSEAQTLQQIINGANLARKTIKSGELRIISQEIEAPSKSPEEIQRIIKSEKDELLQILKERMPNPERSLLYKQQVQEIILSVQERYGKQEEKEERLITFEEYGENPSIIPMNNQYYRVFQIDRKDVDLYTEAAQYVHAGYCRIATYDGQFLLTQNEERLLKPYVAVHHTQSLHHGYEPLNLFGRAIFKIPHHSTRIIGEEEIERGHCFIIEFPLGDSPDLPMLQMPPDEAIDMKVWIDAAMGFCARKLELYNKEEQLIGSVTFSDFHLRNNDIWYPNKIVCTYFKPDDGQIRRSIEHLVKEANFQISFPKDFFTIDLEKVFDSSVNISAASEINFQQHTPKEEKAPERAILECGPRCLLYVCKELGVDTSFKELATLSGLTKKGTTMLGLYQAAQKKGLEPVGMRMSIDDLRKAKLPTIAHTRDTHFLVVESLTENSVDLFDPAGKHDVVSIQQFNEIWDGNVLLFEKAQRKQLPSGKTMPQRFPKIVAQNTTYDLGRVDAGTTGTHVFKFENQGNDVLHITNIESNCACTIAALSGKDIPPGKQGQIEVKLRLPKENRIVEEAIAVHTNDPNQPVFKFTLKGTAYMPIGALPTRFFFGKVSFDQLAQKGVLIQQLDSHEAQILDIRTSSKHITAKTSPPDKSGNFKITVTLGKTIPVGFLEEKILVDYIHDSKKAALEVPIIGEVVGDIEVFPKRFFFGIVNPQQTASKAVMISSTHNQPLEIQAVENSSKYVLIKLTALENQRKYKVQATIKSGAPEGEIVDTIRFRTSSTIQSEIEIPLYCIVKTPVKSRK